jgi:hypothetical protein
MLSQDSFLPNPLQFITESSPYLILYNVENKSAVKHSLTFFLKGIRKKLQEC